MKYVTHSFQISKSHGHGCVTSGQFLNGYILSLVVRKAKISVGTHQGISRFLQVIDGLVDFFDGALEAFGRQSEFSSEGCLELVKAIFEVCEVNIFILSKASPAFYLSECIAPFRISVMGG